MLYITTRSNRDAYTAQRVLRENRGPDGGLYLPFRTPAFSQAELDALAELPFNQCVGELLNRMFKTKLTGWDVEFSVGRYPVRLETLRGGIFMAEAWYNPEGRFERMAADLAALLRGGEKEAPGDWTRIAVRIAVLFGIFAELKRAGIETPVDISVVSGDFSAPISVWYARQWGLPIGNLVCCCNENKGVWDLIAHGQFRTGAVSVPTAVPEADVTVPEDLERLIYECGGSLEVQRYLDACRRGGVYCPNEAVLGKLRQGVYVSVVSAQRMGTTIPSVYRTHSYLLSPYSALAYAGLLDYRAKTGVIRPSLVLAEKSPACDAEATAQCLGISAEELRKL